MRPLTGQAVVNNKGCLSGTRQLSLLDCKGGLNLPSSSALITTSRFNRLEDLLLVIRVQGDRR